MSGVREVVTGSDSCTASAGGPSNPLSSLAGSLLGTESKHRSQLYEASRASATAPRGLAPPTPVDLSPEAAVRRLTGNHASAAAPGAAPSLEAVVNSFNQLDVNQAPGFQVPIGLGPQSRELEAALHHFLHLGPSALEGATQLQQQHGQPLQLNLHRSDQLRIQHRATVLSRQLHGLEQGAEYADQCAQLLLQHLGISAEAPGDGGLQAANQPAAGGAWEDLWTWRGPPEAWELHTRALAREPAAPVLHASQAWANEFVATPGGSTAQPAASPALQHELEAAWRSASMDPRTQQAMATAHAGFDEAWQAAAAGSGAAAAGTGTAGDPWAAEFAESESGGRLAARSDEDEEAAIRSQSRRLADILGQHHDVKIQKSQFAQFMSKMSQGDIPLPAQSAPPARAPAAARGDAWAAEFTQASGPAGSGGDWAEEFFNRGAGAGGSSALSAEHAAETWGNEFLEGELHQREEEYNAAWADVGAASATALGATTGGLARAASYQFAASNPLIGNPEAMDVALSAYAQGTLSRACLALEAVVQTSPDDADAWRLLGTAHAENDDDKQAIAAMSQAERLDPRNPQVLLALGVSHTNELQEGEAAAFLTRWMDTRPEFQHLLQSVDSVGDTGKAFEAFQRAAEAKPDNGDVQTALGILHHLQGNYNAALAVFERALAIRPNDYSLWNKVGATLANSGRNTEARTAYVQALSCKGNYTRAWSNMGICHANLAQYEQACRFYLRALDLNSDAEGIWGYLRTSVLSLGAVELLPAIDRRDVGQLVERFGKATAEDLLAAKSGTADTGRAMEQPETWDVDAWNLVGPSDYEASEWEGFASHLARVRANALSAQPAT